MTPPAWERRLAELLHGGEDLGWGAELEVRDLAGEVVFLAPLARHYRIAEDVVWIRPVTALARSGPDVPSECAPWPCRPSLPALPGASRCLRPERWQR